MATEIRLNIWLENPDLAPAHKRGEHDGIPEDDLWMVIMNCKLCMEKAYPKPWWRRLGR